MSKDDKQRLKTRLWDTFSLESPWQPPSAVPTRSTGFFGATVSQASVFGEELDALLLRERRRLPHIVECCVMYLVLHKTINKEEGLFRKSGASSDTRALVAAFSNEMEKDVDLEKIRDHLMEPGVSIAATLKAYFSKLPSPLVPEEQYGVLIAAFSTGDDTKHMNAVRSVWGELADNRRALLELLLVFLLLTSLHHKRTKMTSSNLATVFAPNIIRKEDISPGEMLLHVAPVNRAMEFMIIHAEEIADRTFRLKTHQQHELAPPDISEMTETEERTDDFEEESTAGPERSTMTPHGGSSHVSAELNALRQRYCLVEEQLARVRVKHQNLEEELVHRDSALLDLAALVAADLGNVRRSDYAAVGEVITRKMEKTMAKSETAETMRRDLEVKYTSVCAERDRYKSLVLKAAKDSATTPKKFQDLQHAMEVQDGLQQALEMQTSLKNRVAEQKALVEERLSECKEALESSVRDRDEVVRAKARLEEEHSTREAAMKTLIAGVEADNDALRSAIVEEKVQAADALGGVREAQLRATNTKRLLDAAERELVHVRATCTAKAADAEGVRARAEAIVEALGKLDTIVLRGITQREEALDKMLLSTRVS